MKFPWNQFDKYMKSLLKQNLFHLNLRRFLVAIYFFEEILYKMNARTYANVHIYTHTYTTHIKLFVKLKLLIFVEKTFIETMSRHVNTNLQYKTSMNWHMFASLHVKYNKNQTQKEHFHFLRRKVIALSTMCQYYKNENDSGHTRY